MAAACGWSAARWRKPPSSTTIRPRRRASSRRQGFELAAHRRSQRRLLPASRSMRRRSRRSWVRSRSPRSSAAASAISPRSTCGSARACAASSSARRPSRTRRWCGRHAANSRTGSSSASMRVAARLPSRVGRETSELTAVELARRFEDAGVAAIVYTDIDRDGVLQGLNLPATAELARATSIPVIASGGLAGIEDVRALLRPEYAKLQGAIAGRALYDGRLDAQRGAGTACGESPALCAIPLGGSLSDAAGTKRPIERAGKCRTETRGISCGGRATSIVISPANTSCPMGRSAAS